MGREIVGGIAEAPEVDAAPHARAGGGGAEGLRRAAIERFEVARRRHRVNQVVGDVHALESRREGRGIEAVAFDHLDAGRLGPKRRTVTDQAPHGAAAAGQRGQQATAHVSGRAREEDATRVHLATIAEGGGHSH